MLLPFDVHAGCCAGASRKARNARAAIEARRTLRQRFVPHAAGIA